VSLKHAILFLSVLAGVGIPTGGMFVEILQVGPYYLNEIVLLAPVALFALWAAHSGRRALLVPGDFRSLGAVLAAMAAVGLMARNEPKFIFKDLRFIVEFVLVVAMSATVIRSGGVSRKEMERIINVCIAVFFLVYSAVFVGIWILKVPSLVANASLHESSFEKTGYRLACHNGLFLGMYLLYLMNKGRLSRGDWAAAGMSVIALLLGQTRSIEGFVLAAALLKFLRGRPWLAIPAVPAAAWAFFSLSEIAGGNADSGTFFMRRLTILLDPAAVFLSLIGGGYLPFFLHLADHSSLKDLLLGGGLGTRVFVPWFEQNDSFDPLNIDLDNTYLTLFVKGGCIGVAMYLFFMKGMFGLFKRGYLSVALYLIWVSNFYSYFTKPAIVEIGVLAALMYTETKDENTPYPLPVDS